MDNRPIGIVDSGVGGLSIWQEIIKLLPNESTIYIGDSANCPYGNRTEEEVYRLSKPIVSFLVKKGIKIIVIACNTISVTCLKKLRLDFPDVPIVGTVPVIKTAVSLTRNRKIGIFSTNRTTKSAYQEYLIEEFANGCKTITVGSNSVAPLIEKGKTTGKELNRVLNKYLKSFKEGNVDTLVLGCSHFSFAKSEISKLIGANVNILDSGGAIARQVRRVLENNNALRKGKPSYMFYTTGDTSKFREVSQKLLENHFKSSLNNIEFVSL